MGRGEEPSRSAPDRRSLEERLRLLPPPAVPPHLRERILAGAPTFGLESKRARPAWLRWSAGGLIAAAAVVLAALLLPLDRSGRRPVVEGPSAPVPSHPGVLYAATADPRETDPCYVLPPLPDWRS